MNHLNLEVDDWQTLLFTNGNGRIGFYRPHLIAMIGQTMLQCWERGWVNGLGGKGDHLFAEKRGPGAEWVRVVRGTGRGQQLRGIRALG